MSEFLANFHFLRPAWLLGLLPALLATGLIWRQLRSGQAWSAVIDPGLLPHLLSGRASKPPRWPMLALLVGWCLATLALAGPSWQQLPQPVERREDALVVLFDLSTSMLAEDITPSRLVRSRQKLLDLLNRKTEGTTGLVAFAGDAHVVSPLTDDLRTVANLLPALSPDIMPVQGSNPGLAVAQAVRLLRDSGLDQGQILLVTDGIRGDDARDIADALSGTAYRLSVLGIGTADGAPIPTDTGFLRDSAGNIVVAGLERAPLEALARKYNGHYSDLQLDDSDVERILRTNALLDLETELLERQVDRWQDMGFWLVLLLLPLALGSFRRGWLLCLFLLPLPEPVHAMDWQDLFRNRDQRASRLLDEGEAQAAAETFRNPDWTAAANYQAGNYDEALQHYQQADTADSWYNRGNALARSGKLPEAIAAYEEALERQGDMEDAAFNKALLEQLMDQQEQEQQQQSDENSDSQQQDQQQAQDQQSGQSGDQGQQQQQQQNGDQGEPGDSSQQSRGENQQDPSQNNEGSPQADQQQDQQPPQDGQPQPAQAQSGDGEEQDTEQQASAARSAEDMERDMANEQWLRRIPDDPSGLLRRKFRYEAQLRAHENRNRDTRGGRDEPNW